MSRLIVKNLPKYFDEDKLKEHFGKKYSDITDVKLQRNAIGESRRFGFIGFKTYDSAVAAVKYFNDSFVHTSRISVQLAKSFADPNVPMSLRDKAREKNMRLAAKEERFQQEQEAMKNNKKRKVAAGKKIDEEIENDPRLKEFMEATKHSSKVTSWSDGVIGKEETATVKEADSDDEYQDLNKSTKAEEKMISLSDFDPVQEEKMISLDSFEQADSKDEEEDVQMKQTIAEEPRKEVSDIEWLNKRKRMIKDGEKDEPVPRIEEPPVRNEPELPAEESVANQISKTGRLFIRNILYSASEEDFRKLFEGFGELEEVHIAVDTRTHKSKGFVYVQFKESGDAVKAFEELDKQIFQGRFLHILPGKVKKSHKMDEFDLKNLPLKKQRELKRKFEASKATFSWNSLFLNENAVLDAVADKIGVEKRDLVDPESSSSGVRQALAEAHVIGDIRKFFESKGIDLTSFNKKQKDDKVILVKNFPYGTTQAEITEIFAAHGELNRVLFPPTGAIAIVEFKDATSGRAAFTKLSYRRFKKNVLYLEKGPIDLFTGVPAAEDLVEKEETADDAKEVKASVGELMNEEEQETEEVGVTTSIFVKNLNFKTTSEELLDLFKALDGFIVAQVKQKPDSKNPGKTLSMGFGFLEFKTKEQAVQCIKDNDEKTIDGHKIQMKLSHRTGIAKAAKPQGKKSNKVIVKNLPFEATRKDMFELFNTFGQLKSVRVPRKFDKSARGFAFVEFNLAKEAEHAIDSLQGVHLLGRRLNIDYAEKDAENAEEEINRLTDKMKKQQNVTEYAKAAKLNGKRRLELEDEEE